MQGIETSCRMNKCNALLKRKKKISRCRGLKRSEFQSSDRSPVPLREMMISKAMLLSSTTRLTT